MRQFCSMALLMGLGFMSLKTYGQTNKTAIEKAQAAIQLMDDEQKYDEAIILLEEAQKLDPASIVYPYEISYAYSAKKEYKKAADILEKLLAHKDVYAQIYQALGNAYDYQGQPDKAIKTYENGLQKFPNAGNLYLELGNMQLNKEDYKKALGYFEKGIEKDPAFPSNYYWAAKIYCSSDEEVWGMIYGEIFMNLESNSKRTEEISKMLFNVYKSEIKFTSENAYEISFSKFNTISVSDAQDPKKFKLPFGMGCYEMAMTMAVLGDTQIDLNSLDRIRSRFVDIYFQKDFPQKYPNILFDYQQKIQKAGHMEAYNHWLLMKGDEAAFSQWEKGNKSKWDAFVNWYFDNRLKLDMNHRFYSGQY